MNPNKIIALHECGSPTFNPDSVMQYMPSPPEPFETEQPATPWPADCLPQGLQAAVDCIASHVQAPQALAGMAVLSAVAHIAQRLVDVERVLGGAMPSSLYILSVAGSGDRKSECFRLATQPIKEFEAAARQTHFKQLNALRQKAATTKGQEAKAEIMLQAPSDPRTLFAEGTMEAITKAFINGSQPALTLATDEGGQFFGGHSMQSETRAHSCGMLTKLYDGGGVERNRAGIDAGSGFRDDVRFGIFLSAQPIVVYASLKDPFFHKQGFLPRVLFSAPDSIVGTRFITDTNRGKKIAEQPAIQLYWTTLERMNKEAIQTDEAGNLTPHCYLLPHTSEAYRLWEAFYNEIEASNHSQLAETAFLNRTGELVRRTAAVFACYRAFDVNQLNDIDSCPHTVLNDINADDMRGAIALVRYSLAEWDRYCNNTGTKLSPIEKDAFELLQWLQKKGGDWKRFTRQQLAQYGLSRLRKKTEQRNAAIDELIDRRWLVDTGKELILYTDVATATFATSANQRHKADEKIAHVANIAVANQLASKSTSSVLLNIEQTDNTEVTNVDEWRAV